MYDGKSQFADRESDQPIPDQFADAARHEEECGRLAHAAYSERTLPAPTWKSNWLPAAERPDLPGDAALLAEDRSAVPSCLRVMAPGSRPRDRGGTVGFRLRGGAGRVIAVIPRVPRDLSTRPEQKNLAPNSATEGSGS